MRPGLVKCCTKRKLRPNHAILDSLSTMSSCQRIQPPSSVLKACQMAPGLLTRTSEPLPAAAFACEAGRAGGIIFCPPKRPASGLLAQ